jgi:hypothetical protein
MPDSPQVERCPNCRGIIWKQPPGSNGYYVCAECGTLDSCPKSHDPGYAPDLQCGYKGCPVHHPFHSQVDKGAEERWTIYVDGENRHVWSASRSRADALLANGDWRKVEVVPASALSTYQQRIEDVEKERAAANREYNRLVREATSKLEAAKQGAEAAEQRISGLVKRLSVLEGALERIDRGEYATGAELREIVRSTLTPKGDE